MLLAPRRGQHRFALISRGMLEQPSDDRQNSPIEPKKEFGESGSLRLKALTRVLIVAASELIQAE